MNTAKVIRKSYKFRIYPSKAQTAKFEQTLDLCRELYNAGLQERRDAWRLNKVSISYYDQQNQLPEIRKIRAELESFSMQIFQDVLKRLDETFKGFFSRVKKGEKAGFPRFQGKNRYSSFTFPQMKYRFRIENNKLCLSKIGKIKIKLHREIVGKIKTCTIKKDTCGKWFAVFFVECEKEILEPTNKSIGLDVGLTHFATLSNGETISNPRFFKTDEKKLARAQRKLSVTKKGTKERIERRKITARISQKIKNKRADFAHKISRNLVNNFDNIFFEDLNIKGMMKNHCLSKAIGDAAWNQTIQFTIYKAECADRIVRLVNPYNTSQNCSNCGEKVEKTLAVKIHDCRNCGLQMDRDLNAAKNILTLGLQSLAKA